MSTINPAFIYPLLKSYQWAKEKDLKLIPHTDYNIADVGEVVICAIDQDDNLAYLPPDAFPKISEQQLFEQAKSNLAVKLQKLEWNELNFKNQVPGLKIQALSNHFYASEALLLPEKLQQHINY